MIRRGPAGLWYHQAEGVATPAVEGASPARTSSSARFTSEFADLNSVDYLNYDQRPTFVLDLEAYRIEKDPFSPLAFCNFALLKSFGLHEVVTRTFSLKKTESQHDDERAFAKWIIHQSASKRLRKSKAFFDTLWTVASTSDDWAVVSGVELSQSDFGSFNAVQDSDNSSPQDVEMHNASSRNSISSMETDLRSEIVPRPTKAPSTAAWPPSGLGDSAHIRLIRDLDWAATSIGAISTWPPQLRQCCEMMLVSPDPVAIFWGPDLIMLYNEAYVAIAANKHPEMMGGSARVQWKEIWDVYDPLFDQIRVDYKALKQADAQVFLQRVDYLEEGFFNLTVLPIFDEEGSVVGFYEPVSNITKQTLSEQRMHTLLKVSQRISSATSLEELWHLLLEALKEHLNCMHFAVLYSLQPDTPPIAGQQYALEGTVGLVGDTGSFPSTIGIDNLAQDHILSAMRQARESRTTVMLKKSDESLSPSLLQNLKAAGMEDLPRDCIVHPLSSSVDESIDGFLIIGVSPKRRYDEDYGLFIDLLTRQVESTITFVKLFENERERLRQQALDESRLKFKKFAENAPVGIFSCDPVGNITFCNEAWLEISGHDRNDMSAESWANDVHPDIAGELFERWAKLVSLNEVQTFEVAYKKPWTPQGRFDDSITLDRTWGVASTYPEFSDEGKMTAIVWCVTDISSWKWADIIHSQRLSEALELKRQQENFLDITSHESVSLPSDGCAHEKLH
jgi:PAS domain S-box-containing protein